MIHTYTPYLIGIHTVCHMLVIICIIIRRDSLGYGLLIIIMIIVMH